MLTLKALRYVRDSNAAAAKMLDTYDNPSDAQRAAFLRHRKREVWARHRIAKWLMPKAAADMAKAA